MVRFLFDIGIYVIAIASLACWAVSAEESVLKDESPYANIPTVCPFPQPNWRNTTTNLPHETDCTKFYKCFLGKGVLQQCPLMIEGDPHTRLHYNRLLQVCDWPWQAGCATCPLRNRDGTYPPPSKISNDAQCNTYYQCNNGEKSLQYCYDGKCFSRTCQECVHNREGGNCPGGPTPGICTTGDRKAHECDCAKYYICYDNTDWIRFQCDSGLHFSPTRKECVAPNIAGCLV